MRASSSRTPAHGRALNRSTRNGASVPSQSSSKSGLAPREKPRKNSSSLFAASGVNVRSLPKPVYDAPLPLAERARLPSPPHALSCPCTIPIQQGGALVLSCKPVNHMPIDTIENTAKQLVLTVQDYSLFAARAFMTLWSDPRYWPEFLVQRFINARAANR